MLSVKLKRNGPFVQEMVARRASFRGMNSLAIRAVVPYDLRWWYWLEWGTAARGIEPYASGSEYLIEPLGSYPLRWYDYEGKYNSSGKPGWVARELVIHPGIYPRRFVFHSMPYIAKDCHYEFKKWLETGALQIRADKIRRFMLEVFPKIIRFWLYENLKASPEPVPTGWTGTTYNRRYRRTMDPKWARLGGQLATDVFDAALNFRDTSR